MGTALRLAAFALWLAALVAPTAALQGGAALRGYEVLARGTALLLFTLPISILLVPFFFLSVASNALVVREAVLAARRVEREVSLRGTVLLYAALLLNFSMASQLASSRGPAASVLRFLPGLPGVHLWLVGIPLPTPRPSAWRALHAEAAETSSSG